MAEIILGPIAELVLGELVGLTKEQIGLLRTPKDEIQKLHDTVTTINNVLLDAEEKQGHNRQVKHWLEKLSDAMYDADDLIDDFSIEARRRRQAAAAANDARSGTSACCKVVWFRSSSFFKGLNYNRKMAGEIKTIREKLNAITKESADFRLEVRSEGALLPSLSRRETDSVPPLIVVGREDDKKNIIEMLLNANSEANISVVPIVGMGGLGKTTLAQLVLDDKRVQEHFAIKVWVYVSRSFDIKVILKKMLESITPETQTSLQLDILQKQLGEKITGKRFLFVLDDVWEENDKSWENLAKHLNAGAPGSKVLVTTRSTKVAEAGRKNLKSERCTEVVMPYFLGGFSLEESWNFLVKKAHPQPVPQDPRVREIGLKILQKCGGVPLAVSTVAGILICTPEVEWSSFLEKRFSSIANDGDDTLSVLRLSFDVLESHMRNCFTYCKLFPKGHKFEVEVLIRLWVIQGYVKSEDDGLKCFKKLWWRSFFMQVEEDKFGNITTCRMHDLMHDLADSISREEFLRSSSSAFQRRITPSTRHVSLFEEEQNDDTGGEGGVHNELGNARKVRTLICAETLSREEWQRMFRNFIRLRVLMVCGKWLNSDASIPLDFVAELKHLRFLSLKCMGMKCLPDSVSNLLNLQFLGVGSKELEELPKNISRLVNLKHLWFYGGNMTHMPKGIGELKSLETLPFFVVGKKSEKVGGLDELKELNALHGELTIKNLKNAESLGTSGYVLKSKKHLQSLTLNWGSSNRDSCGSDVTSHDEEILEMLQPHENLMKLEVIGGYGGIKFPDWASCITKLVEFTLIDCKKCEYLPPLHQLPYLKKLKIEDCPQLKGINDSREGGYPCDEEEPSFPCLASLCIKNCPKLTQMPNFPFVEGVVEIMEASLKPLAKTMRMKIKRGGRDGGGVLDADTILYFPSSSPLVCPPLSKVTKLTLVEIEDDLQSLARDDGFSNLISLEKLWIYNCDFCVKLPSWLCSSRSLTEIRIEYCETVEWLPPLHELPCLWRLQLESCPKLKGCWWRKGKGKGNNNKDDDDEYYNNRYEEQSSTSAARGPPEIETEGEFDGKEDDQEEEEQWPHFPCLETLEVSECPNLTRLPLFPTVEVFLRLNDTRSEALVRTMKMKVGVGAGRRTVLVHPPLSKLTSLYLTKIDDLESLPEQGLRNLTSLERLDITGCKRLASLPAAMRHLTSLKILEIDGCPRLASLPAAMRHLTSLQSLVIDECPQLTQRCRKGEGEDWPNISHIPDIRLDGRMIPLKRSYGQLLPC